MVVWVHIMTNQAPAPAIHCSYDKLGRVTLGAEITKENGGWRCLIIHKQVSLLTSLCTVWYHISLPVVFLIQLIVSEILYIHNYIIYAHKSEMSMESFLSTFLRAAGSRED